LGREVLGREVLVREFRLLVLILNLQTLRKGPQSLHREIAGRVHALLQTF